MVSLLLPPDGTVLIKLEQCLLHTFHIPGLQGQPRQQGLWRWAELRMRDHHVPPIFSQVLALGME